MRDGGEDVSCVRCSPFNAISVVYAALASLGINIKILEVVVEVNRPSAKVSSEECSVCSEYGRYVYSSLLSQWQSYPSKPFVEMCNDCFLPLMRYKL